MIESGSRSETGATISNPRTFLITCSLFTSGRRGPRRLLTPSCPSFLHVLPVQASGKVRLTGFGIATQNPDRRDREPTETRDQRHVSTSDRYGFRVFIRRPVRGA